MEADFYRIAEDLAGRKVDQLALCRSGRNSKVYKVTCGDVAYALKNYPSRADDPRDRFGTEVRALQFYEANNNPHTPRLQAVDMQRGVVLMEWIEGRSLAAPAAADIGQALDFISRTHAAEANGGEVFSLAAEPCLSGADLDGHVALRLDKLYSIAGWEPELKSFLMHELAPVLERVRTHAQRSLHSARLPRSRQSLIPADFGFHNALRTDGGRVYFIDFEYFGWDDPVRLAADFLLHPGMTLDDESRNQFCRGMVDIFGADEEFERRLLELAPLYGIRWALILLNEFLPELWQARVFAGEEAPWQEKKAEQLAKARMTLDKTMACLDPS